MQWPWRKSEAAPLPSPQAEAGPISPESVRRELEKILASPEFANAIRLRELLSFLVEETFNGAEAIKEVTVAMRVFNRRASFDSSGDSVVRVGALHLRNRLRDYYAGSGRLDEVIIEVPKGSYLPVFRRVDRGIPSGSPGHPGLPRKAMAAGGILLAVLVATAWWLVPGTAHHPNPSIAVLPMANLGDPEMDSLCQAFTEDLTTELARLPQLRVIARTSAGQFRSQSGDVREIGRRLGVAGDPGTLGAQRQLPHAGLGRDRGHGADAFADGQRGSHGARDGALSLTSTELSGPPGSPLPERRGFPGGAAREALPDEFCLVAASPCAAGREWPSRERSPAA